MLRRVRVREERGVRVGVRRCRGDRGRGRVLWWVVSLQSRRLRCRIITHVCRLKKHVTVIHSRTDIT